MRRQPLPATRRTVLAGAAGVVTATVTAATLQRAETATADTPARPPTGRSWSGVRTVQLPRSAFHRVGPDEWISGHLSTGPFAMVAFTWTRSADHAQFEVCVDHPSGDHPSGAGAIRGRWYQVTALHDRPDHGSREERSTPHGATSPFWTGRGHGAQVRIRGRRVPHGLRLTLVNPAPATAAEVAHLHGPARLGGGQSRAVVLPSSTAEMPLIQPRSAWGANESWRSGDPVYNKTIKQLHVHHTATGNDYSLEDVPALIRGMYYYHTHTLGWSDIGYNFLVDRFGNLWEGRAGGVDLPVRGAHTLGFNDSSTGCSMIGNYEEVAPAQVALDAICQLAAWKLTLYGRDPMGWTTVKSRGSDRFPAGDTVSLPVIDGHRDTNDTACPGYLLYDQLGTIRTSTQALMVPPITLTTPPALTGDPVVGQTLAAQPGVFTPPDATVAYAWLRDGVPIVGANAPAYLVTVEDLGTTISATLTYSHPGYDVLVLSVTSTGPVRAAPTIALGATGRHGHLHLHIHAQADGVAVLNGTVQVRIGDRRRTVAVIDGKAIARFLDLPTGTHHVHARLVSTALVTHATTAAKLTVKAKTVSISP